MRKPRRGRVRAEGECWGRVGEGKRWAWGGGDGRSGLASGGLSVR